MGPYLSQPLGSSSCGAYSLAYYLWETNKSKLINDRSFVDALYKKIQIGPNLVGIPEKYSHPAKMVEELKKNWFSDASMCMLSASSLMEPIVAEALNSISDNKKNVFTELENYAGNYAIIHCRMGTSSDLHYHFMLIKYDNFAFTLMDSYYSLDHVGWEVFSLGHNDKLVLAREANYYYTGFGILIK